MPLSGGVPGGLRRAETAGCRGELVGELESSGRVGRYAACNVADIELATAMAAFVSVSLPMQTVLMTTYSNGRASSAAASAKYSSSPPGVTINSAVAGRPMDRETCGRLRGRNTNDPGPASNRSSPHSTYSAPVKT